MEKLFMGTIREGNPFSTGYQSQKSYTELQICVQYTFHATRVSTPPSPQLWALYKTLGTGALAYCSSDETFITSLFDRFLKRILIF